MLLRGTEIQRVVAGGDLRVSPLLVDVPVLMREQRLGRGQAAQLEEAYVFPDADEHFVLVVRGPDTRGDWLADAEDAPGIEYVTIFHGRSFHVRVRHAQRLASFLRPFGHKRDKRDAREVGDHGACLSSICR